MATVEASENHRGMTVEKRARRTPSNVDSSSVFCNADILFHIINTDPEAIGASVRGVNVAGKRACCKFKRLTLEDLCVPFTTYTYPTIFHANNELDVESYPEWANTVSTSDVPTSRRAFTRALSKSVVMLPITDVAEHIAALPARYLHRLQATHQAPKEGIDVFQTRRVHLVNVKHVMREVIRVYGGVWSLLARRHRRRRHKRISNVLMPPLPAKQVAAIECVQQLLHDSSGPFYMLHERDQKYVLDAVSRIYEDSVHE
jgi:hypothetical protein